MFFNQHCILNIGYCDMSCLSFWENLLCHAAQSGEKPCFLVLLTWNWVHGDYAILSNQTSLYTVTPKIPIIKFQEFIKSTFWKLSACRVILLFYFSELMPTLKRSKDLTVKGLRKCDQIDTLIDHWWHQPGLRLDLDPIDMDSKWSIHVSGAQTGIRSAASDTRCNETVLVWGLSS